MKRFLFILLVSATISTQAQEKVSSIGLRGGGLSGVSFKYIDNDFLAFELIAGAKEGGFLLTGLVQKYSPLASGHVAGLFFFMGGGAHAGYSKYSEYVNWVGDGMSYYTYYEETNPIVGGDFILGAAYHFESIPLHLSLDYKPYFEIFGEESFRIDLWDIGFTVRYAFNQ